MSGNIARQGASYRNGLVLGLTMAEILLLLLFCMLIALGAAMQNERQERRKVEEKLALSEASAKTASSLTEALNASPQLAEAVAAASGSTAPEEVDKFWKRLVEGNAVAEALERAGLSREHASANASALAEADKVLREAKGDPRRFAGDAALGAKARADMVSKGMASDDEKVLQALDRGASQQAEAEKAKGAGRHSWPPIISLSEADGFYFASGRAELDPSFVESLGKNVLPRILEIARAYDVDTIEVVGHTDEQPLGMRPSNLDRGLGQVLRKQTGVASLVPGDNAGLGLARAVAVVSRLRADQRLGEFRVLPLSAGQLISTDQRLSTSDTGGDVKQRRRIEIRLRQSQRPETPQEGGVLPKWIRLPGL